MGKTLSYFLQVCLILRLRILKEKMIAGSFSFVNLLFGNPTMIKHGII